MYEYETFYDTSRNVRRKVPSDTTDRRMSIACSPGTSASPTSMFPIKDTIPVTGANNAEAMDVILTRSRPREYRV